VPTFNPYYPTGTGVPQNLVVNINMGIEQPSFTSASKHRDAMRVASRSICRATGWGGSITPSPSTTMRIASTGR